MERKVCRKCKNNYITGNKFCIYCGAKLGRPLKVEDESSEVNSTNNKPINRIHECKNCGYTWYTYTTDDLAEFCPECGKPAPGIELKNIDLKEVKSKYKLTEEQELKAVCDEVFKDTSNTVQVENEINYFQNKKIRISK